MKVICVFITMVSLIHAQPWPGRSWRASPSWAWSMPIQPHTTTPSHKAHRSLSYPSRHLTRPRSVPPLLHLFPLPLPNILFPFVVCPVSRASPQPPSPTRLATLPRPALPPSACMLLLSFPSLTLLTSFRPFRFSPFPFRPCFQVGGLGFVVPACIVAGQ